MAQLRFSFLLLLLLPFLISCGSKDTTTAGGGDRLLLSADPQQIGLKGTSTLTVTGSDENGNPLPDGTLVTFSVDEAGRVSPNNVLLQGGSATSTYQATFAEGEIRITATSGSVEANITITVVDTEFDRNVFVSATPTTLPSGGGTAEINAVVTDGSGQPIEGIEVQFTTTAGTLQSGGDSITTNSNGVATDTLVTSESATVTATTDDNFSGSTTVQVGIGRIVCHLSVSTRTPQVNESVSFFDTSDDPSNQIERYHWDFGDDISADGRNVQHAYREAGTFEVVHSVVDRNGNTIFCDPVSIEVSD